MPFGARLHDLMRATIACREQALVSRAHARMFRAPTESSSLLQGDFRSVFRSTKKQDAPSRLRNESIWESVASGGSGDNVESRCRGLPAFGNVYRHQHLALDVVVAGDFVRTPTES